MVYHSSQTGRDIGGLRLTVVSDSGVNWLYSETGYELGGTTHLEEDADSQTIQGD